MNSRTMHHTISISVGLSELSIDFPEELLRDHTYKVRGLALIGHPHPLLGGSMDNKVAQTLAKTMTMLGYVSVRPNFRGVGQSEGTFDDGVGEVDDLEQILAWMQKPSSWLELLGAQENAWFQEVRSMPFVLAGFSFGSYVNSNLAQRLINRGKSPDRLVLVGSAAGKWDMPNIPPNTIVIHGELDETIPLKAVFEWLMSQETVVHVIPGADHFFHRKLHLIRDTVISLWDAK
jgi:alpha/beta superfamily hydrolase